MSCQGCKVSDLTYQFDLQGQYNEALTDKVKEHLQRNDVPVTLTKENKLKVPEHHIREILDFFEDHMETDQIFFRTSQGEWSPLSEISEVLETSWIDEIILEELVHCHYQPILRSDGELFGYELLARFTDGEGNMVYPGELFQAARLRGRLYALDRVCRMAAVRHAARLDKVKAFINFIPTSIYSPEFCLRSTMQLASQLNLDPQQLVFEVVETDKVDDVEHLKKILTYYKDKGFMYALDDVGEGFSTIELLTGIEPHYMKLDRKFVSDVHEDPEKQRVAHLFLEKARSMGTIPLAEGIEQQQEYQWLKDAGYVLFQGYYFGRPQSEPVPRDALNF
ncbi:EAL domain-containing protein [Chryseomicrobium palamuruense]|uniref:EAL domain-containing protein n=1 Tax=Chryseomicrobium palamuruense TaxID=682973 RepID=A0ABV8UXV6_9BACL